ncbi:PMT domain-containing protein [Planctomycetales bacterium 10988]|nr:PMT domain-containing protein [Planctomycetales bacterium 10988]
MLLNLWTILTWAALLMACYGLGRPLLRGILPPMREPLEVAVWSLMLGALGYGLLFSLLGLLGWLSYWFILFATILGGYGTLLEWMRPQPPEWLLLEPRPLAQVESWRYLAAPPWWLSALLGVLAVIALGCSFISALAPPTAGDALCYHLQLPKVFLESGSLIHLPDSERSTFPLLVSIWYLWALALDGPVCAGLVHWSLGVLFAAATAVLASPLIGRPWGWIAGAVVLLVPGVHNQMTAPLNDLGVAVMGVLMLAAWCGLLWRSEHDGWKTLLGLAAGGALSIKYNALLLVVVLILIWGIYAWRHRQGWQLWRMQVGWVLIIALSVSGMWYVRAAWHRGNPVYPYADSVFSMAGANTDADAPDPMPATKRPLGTNPLLWFSAPWELTMSPEKFGGRSHQWGFLFLAFMPGLLFVRRLRGLGWLLMIASGYAVLCFFLRQNLRFFLPILPLLALAVAWVLAEISRGPRWGKVAIAVVFLGMGCFSSAIAARRSLPHWEVAIGTESRQEYLMRHEPTFYIAQVANLILSPESRILSQELRAFYFDSALVRESVFRQRTGYPQRIPPGKSLGTYLQEEGFTHVLLASSLTPGGIVYDSTLSDLVHQQGDLSEDEKIIPLQTSEVRDADGVLRRYELWQLPLTHRHSSAAVMRAQSLTERSFQ